jgi:hypothetical protein
LLAGVPVPTNHTPNAALPRVDNALDAVAVAVAVARIGGTLRRGLVGVVGARGRLSGARQARQGNDGQHERAGVPHELSQAMPSLSRSWTGWEPGVTLNGRPISVQFTPADPRVRLRRSARSEFSLFSAGSASRGTIAA